MHQQSQKGQRRVNGREIGTRREGISLVASFKKGICTYRNSSRGCACEGEWGGAERIPPKQARTRTYRAIIALVVKE
jgi:hypothetical protein